MFNEQPQPPDSRTPQNLDATLAYAGLIGVHFVTFLVGGSYVISQNYIIWTVIVLPSLALIVALGLVLNRRLHWGQFVFLMIVAIACSLIQFMISAVAGASV